jgi:hypothetical protein
MKAEQAEAMISVFETELNKLGIQTAGLDPCALANVLYSTLNTTKKLIGSGSFPSASWAIGRGIAAIHGGISEWKRKMGCPKNGQ